MKRLPWLSLASACSLRLTPLAAPALISLILIGAPAAQAAGTAVISGSISNSATHNTLEGAAVGVPALNLSVLTDNTGRYTLSGLPDGMHEIVVTYIGLDPVR
ncbi:MAG: carboxypeptidase-like regulatory domain-containing protein, partial [Opitutaceae bacterium]